MREPLNNKIYLSLPDSIFELVEEISVKKKYPLAKAVRLILKHYFKLTGKMV